MKKFLFVMMGLVALPSVASAVNVVGGVNPTITFDTTPAASDWASGAPAGAGNTANDNAGLDTLIGPLTQAAFAGTLATSGTLPPTTAIANWRHNTNAAGLFLQSDPTGVAANVLKASLINASPNFISDLAVTFDVGLANFTPVEQVPGVRAYWSATGAASSWTAAGTFDVGAGQTFNIAGLGTSWENNPLYLLFVDDNADGGTEGYYSLDNVILNATLGGPKAPPTPVFGTLTPDQSQAFEVAGTGLPLSNGAVGTPTAIQGDNALQTNNAQLNAVTDQVDLRGVPASSSVIVGVDLKAWESSQTSDFEAADRVAVIAEWSADGLTFTDLPLIDVVGAPALTPFDPLVPNPADGIRATFGPTEATNNVDAAFVHRQVTLPGNAETVRVRVILNTDSATEFMAVDNITVTAVPVPEPATLAMLSLGLIGLCAVRRRK